MFSVSGNIKAAKSPSSENAPEKVKGWYSSFLLHASKKEAVIPPNLLKRPTDPSILPLNKVGTNSVAYVKSKV